MDTAFVKTELVLSLLSLQLQAWRWQAGGLAIISSLLEALWCGRGELVLLWENAGHSGTGEKANTKCLCSSSLVWVPSKTTLRLPAQKEGENHTGALFLAKSVQCT